jgi:hypothetical protein
MTAFTNVFFKICKLFAPALLLVGAAAFVGTSLTAAALAQVDGFGHPIKDKKEEEYHQPARNENAYKDALRRIPDTKEKYDPWGTVRGDKPAPKQ